ncbi:hypothetical protein GEMRC1_004587 [Eukaryota sp. GEM-RC1]
MPVRTRSSAKELKKPKIEKEVESVEDESVEDESYNKKSLFADSDGDDNSQSELSDNEEDLDLTDAPLIDDFGDEELSSSDNEDDDDTLSFEDKAKLYAKRVKAVQEDAAAEIQEVSIANINIFPDNETEALSDRTVINERIQAILHVLSEFSSRKSPDKSRSDYLERLTVDLAVFYEFLPNLITKFLRLFSPHELLTYLEQVEAPRPIVIRTNTLKTRRKDLAKALITRGVNLEPIQWSSVGLIVFDSQVPIGATPEYLGGLYMIQSASSFLPVMALDPKPNESILDMCSAPGGKTTFISQLMKNTGFVVANDVSVDRTKGLIANIHRLGVTNTVVVNYDGRKLDQKLGVFDRVLLDAPCSGLGVIDKDPSVKLSRTDDDIKKTTHLQKELLRTAISLTKSGGTIVYSTCSITLEENEEVIDYALSSCPVSIVDTGIEFGEPGIYVNGSKVLNKKVTLCRRFYPHVHNIHGFFVCKLRKH